MPKRRWANWQPCWIYDYDYDFWRNDEYDRCLPKRALSLLTIMLDKYIHKCVSYPSETIQKLSDLLSLLSFMLFSSVPIGILVFTMLFQLQYMQPQTPSVQSAATIIYKSPLTYLPLDKMAAISQTIFSNAFSWMKNFVFWLQFHWRLFRRVQLTILQHWFR